MPKTVAERTRHLSFRIDVDDNAKIDKIRSAMEARFGIYPQRSDVLRKILDYGIEVFCKKNNIALGAALSKKPTNKPATKKTPPKKTPPKTEKVEKAPEVKEPAAS